ncbi:MAG: MMPL family transporter [Corynebacterium casei]|uniref:RND superfamily drug exporter n=2 Tax=Corynebacterium casei TaxID=160386 RepID=A0ABN4C8S4_9CORY|nr:MMPL family transporter [Corynebacterium casei]AHI18940.1 RND superfamily drug exporter [Corynebacterium casei LMG S-19264]MDN6313596.1 MMPL family transporter [Corynebacterium casei]MDN6361380.1 MMPL family transporter [Corynebacterium casei]MDN6382850.1 MMPL family transporter [Corynebacterium casei]MDN6394242.1 MMPL family transporter [Corynebacterium casei]
MAKFLFRVGRWSYLNKWKVIIAWVLLLAGVGGAAAALMKPMTSEFSISGTPAIEATYRTVELFPEGGNPANAASVNLVFKAPDGEKLSDPENSEAIDEVITYLEDNLAMGDTMRFGNPIEFSPEFEQGVVDQFTEMGLPEEAAREDADNLSMVNEDETIAYTTFNFDAESPYSVEQSDKDIVTDAMNIGRDLGLQVEAGGAGFGDEIAVNTTSELIGLGVAFLVLIFTFGSLVSAGMPLISAVIGVGLGSLGLFIATHWVELNNITPVLAVMIGLAVGIDYALFILSRYRSERETKDGPDAAGMAAGTAGSSVVFAGATVFIALFALIVANIGFLTAMGLAAAGTVAISVVVALTLIPALLGVLGDKAFAGRIPGVAGNRRRAKKNKSNKQDMKSSQLANEVGVAGDQIADAEFGAAAPAEAEPPKGKFRMTPTMGNRWVRLVRKMPGVVMAFVVLSLGALSAPVLNMELSLPADTTSNPDTTQRKAADLLSEGFYPGINGPFLVIVDAENINTESAALQPLMAAQGEDSTVEEQAQLSSYMYTADALKRVGGVRHAQIVGLSEDGQAAQIMVSPQTSPTDVATVGVASALREATSRIEDATGAELGMTGLTAVQLDITERLEEAMPLYLALVVGLAILLLFLVFRSLLVPLVAALGFLLSVGSAFGLTVLVWQEGLWDLVPAPGPLISFMPIFLIGVTFGLAMDYQVFLVTRMREHYSHTGGEPSPGSPYSGVDESTIVGFTQGARVVTAAAIIMISVFVAFINQPLPFIQIFGFALAVAVFFDAFFIRMSLVPATMFLMGKATWWLPKWMDKAMPPLDIEGTALEKEWEEKERAQRTEEQDLSAK